jgi:hypothetical protein
VNGFVAGDSDAEHLARLADLLGLSERGRERLQAKVGRGHLGGSCAI